MFCLKRIFSIFKIIYFFILIFITLSGATVHSADVILTWERPNDTRVTGYKIYYGLAADDFKSTPEEIINSPDQTSCNIYDLNSGNTYGFAAKSFDDKDNESGFSELIFYDVIETSDKSPSDDDGSNENVDNIIDQDNNNDNGNDDLGDNNIDDDHSGSSSGGGCFISEVSNLNIWD